MYDATGMAFEKAPRLFRDPVHLQLRYERVEDERHIPSPAFGDKRFGWVMQRLIDTPVFQRLRHIRQNGLTNLVFHGAEHSRFSHSMGVAYLAGEMYDRICRNMGEEPDDETRLATCAAGLLHDIGHGPFSHTLEEALDVLGIEFAHEAMTLRIIRESVVAETLGHVDQTFPERVAEYISKKVKKPHWSHKLVSSQLDADRLDYLLRDAAACGLRGHTYDLARLLDMLRHVDGQLVGVDRKGLETVEGYLVALDQMYRAIYFHHTVRAASVLLTSVLRRAVMLASNGDKDVFSTRDRRHPLKRFFDTGGQCDLETYSHLGEFHVWVLVDEWRGHPDPILSDLSRRLYERRLPKTIQLPAKPKQSLELIAKARDLTCKRIAHVDATLVDFYVAVDEAERTSYKLYDWREEEKPDESIYICERNGKSWPIHAYGESKIINALKDTRYVSRLMFPYEIRDDMQAGALR